MDRMITRASGTVVTSVYSKSLVLDLTSCVDAVSEGNMARLVKEESKDSSVIAVAYISSTIVDIDKAVVFDAGRIVAGKAA